MKLKVFYPHQDVNTMSIHGLGIQQQALICHLAFRGIGTDECGPGEKFCQYNSQTKI
jgi:hypothetical protein